MSRIRRKLAGLLLGFMFGLLALELVPVQPAQAFTSSNADTAMSAFVSTFWNSTTKYFYTNSDHQIHTHAFGPESGLYTDFWWEAQLWETVMDAYQRTNSSTYRQMIDDVYDGFAAYYPTFYNNFNDDQGWWALASIRAYEITGSTRYKDRAVSLFNTIYGESDSTLGGGIWWRKSPHDQKNVATNGPAIITAVKLKNATGDSTYLTKAQSLYSWMKSNLSDGAGHVYDHVDSTGVSKWDFTYNFGAFIGAAGALYGATSTSSYLTDATNAANWVTGKLTNGGTLLYEGVDDGGGFKMILARYLNRLVVDQGQTQYRVFLQNNATQAWNHRRTSDNIIGLDWSAPTNSGFIQSLTSAAGAAIMQFVPADNVTGILAENGTCEAENGSLHSLSSEATYSGYHGTSYLAGWNSNGQWVDFTVNVASSGNYTLTLRYAAGAGNASRYIFVNGSGIVSNQSFANTGSWSTWNTVTISGVALNAGNNTVSVIFSSTQGSNNWLNLDELTVS